MAERDGPTSTSDDRRTDAETAAGDWIFETQSHYDPTDSRNLTTVIVGAIAEAEGVSMTEVLSPPLYDVVDVAALEEALFGRPSGTNDRVESVVEFCYHGYKVSVESNGWVTVSTRADEAAVDG
ncbi:MAG: HalOD1 output domain-containing protein [Halobacteriaceae archaeon]